MKRLLLVLAVPILLFSQSTVFGIFPPSPVSIIAPADSAVSVSSPVHFIWTKSQLATAYTLQISLNHDFDLVIVNRSVTDTTYSDSTLETSMRYYWRVRAENGDGISAWATAMFATILDTPSLLSPANAATDVAVNVLLKWSKIRNAESYRLQIDTNAAFSTIFEDSTVADTLCRPYPFLTANTQFYWRVKAISADDTGSFSALSSFTTGIDTSEPKISLPKIIDIGTVNAGSAKDTTIIFTNTGNDTLIISNITDQMWRTASAGLSFGQTNPVSSLVCTSTDLFAGNINDGVFRSTDLGNSWTMTNLNTRFVEHLIASGFYLFAGTYLNGVFRSTDNGATWTTSTMKSKNNTIYNGVNSLVAGSNGKGGINLFGGPAGAAMFLSTDNGSSWIDVYSNLPGFNQTNALTVSPDGAGGINVFAGGTNGIYRSTNNGASWTAVNSGLPTSRNIGTLAANGKKIFASTFNETLCSTNSGANWIPSDTIGFVRSFAFHGKNVFAASVHGVYLSTDNGDSWTAVNSGLMGNSGRSFTGNGSDLFVGTDTAGVFRSNYLHIAAEPSTTTLAPGASDTLTIHIRAVPLGTIKGRLIISSNALSSSDTLVISGIGSAYGMTVSSKKISVGTVKIGQSKGTIISITNTGSDDLIITSIVSDNAAFTVSPATLIIAAGITATDTIRFSPTESGADSATIVISSNAIPSLDTIIVSASGSLTGVAENNAVPTVFSLSQNFPNPFNPSTTILYGLPNRSRVRIQVFNTLGQVVAELMNNEQEAGYHSITWNDRVASGIYFYRLEAEPMDAPNSRFVVTKKMILLK